MSLPFSPGIHPSILSATEDELRRLMRPETDREEFLMRVIEQMVPLMEINTSMDIEDLDPDDHEQVRRVADVIRELDQNRESNGRLQSRLRELRHGVKDAYLEGAAIASVEDRLQAVLTSLGSLIKNIDSRFP